MREKWTGRYKDTNNSFPYSLLAICELNLILSNNNLSFFFIRRRSIYCQVLNALFAILITIGSFSIGLERTVHKNGFIHDRLLDNQKRCSPLTDKKERGNCSNSLRQMPKVSANISQRAWTKGNSMFSRRILVAY